MEIRTLKAQERPTLAGMLDAWRLAEGWTAGDRFRRQIEFDPDWSDENVFVATEQERILAGVSILPRHLKILGHSIPTGGLSNLYTDPDSRSRGVATELLERVCEDMRFRGLELVVTFPGSGSSLSQFFAKRGWHSWGGQQTILRCDLDARTSKAGESEAIELQKIWAEDYRAIQAVKSIHAAYGASRSGTVVRNDDTWQACLQLTPAPREEFWVARRGGLIVAYVRASIIEDVLTVTELGRFEDGASALAILVSSLLEPRDEDELIKDAAVGRLSSEQLRSFMVLPTFDDIGLMVALEHRGIRSHPMDDAPASFRCVNLIGVASRLDVDLLPEEDGRSFLHRIQPPDAMVFWPADRF